MDITEVVFLFWSAEEAKVTSEGIEKGGAWNSTYNRSIAP